MRWRLRRGRRPVAFKVIRGSQISRPLKLHVSFNLTCYYSAWHIYNETGEQRACERKQLQRASLVSRARRRRKQGSELGGARR